MESLETYEAKGRGKWRSYKPLRTDANQPDIMKHLRKLGYTVQSLHEQGKGVFDLIAAKKGLNIFCEVKDGVKPLSAREYTTPQRKWNFAWQGMRCVLTCKDDCVRMDNQVRAILKQIEAAGIPLHVTGSQELQYQIKLY